MCLVFCHVRRIYYDSDVDDVCAVCMHNLPSGQRQCDKCQHAGDAVCNLTLAPLPADRWCCHCNAVQVDGWHESGGEDLCGYLRSQGLREALNLYEAVYLENGPGRFRVALSSLRVPLTYGIEMVHWAQQRRGMGDDEAVEEAPASGGEFAVLI